MKNPLKPPSLRHHSTPVRVLLILVAVVVGGFVAVMVLGVGLMLAGYEAEPEQAAPPAAAVSTPTPETAGTTPPAEPEPAPTSTPEPAETTAAAPEPAEVPEPEPAAVEAGFEQWLKDNFYESSTWYPHVTGSEDVFGSLWIHTDIYPDAEGKSFAQPICTAGKFYMMDKGENSAVMVRAVDGQRLADC